MKKMEIARSKENKMKIYCARPITGCSFEEVTSYYEKTRDSLKVFGYDVLIPMCGKGYLKNETEFKSDGYKQPMSTDRAIIQRDNWMCHQCDVLFANLLYSTRISIGTIMEIAWCYDNRKHVVVAMEGDNIHRHAFVNEAAAIVFPSYNECMEYLSKLASMEI